MQMSDGSRRRFLKRSLAAGVALGAAGLLGCKSGDQGATTGGPGPVTSVKESGPAPAAAAKPTGVQLAVAKGGDSPANLVRAAIDALGGMGAFVGAGKKVCLKPNLSWDRPPGTGANVHPDVLSELVKMCYEAGAKEVVAVDFTLAFDPLFANGGRDAVEGERGKMIELRRDDKELFEEVELVSGLKALPKLGIKERIAYDFLKADTVVNVAVLKTHSSTGLSLALKNLMGIAYGRAQYHGGSAAGISSGQWVKSQVLDQSIADLAKQVKDRINLTVVDCSYIMRSSAGPKGLDGDDGEPMMHMVAGTDMVACDTQAALLFGMKPEEIKTKVAHIALAEALGVGTMDLKSLKTQEVSV
jgi:uncharacterized protein (DUF362 family)